MTKIIAIMIFVIIEQPYPKQCAFGYVRYKIASENISRTGQIQRWSTASYIPVQIQSQKSKSRTIRMIRSYDWITSDAVTELDLDVVCCQILKKYTCITNVTYIGRNSTGSTGHRKNQQPSKDPPPPQRKSARFLPIMEQRNVARTFPLWHSFISWLSKHPQRNIWILMCALFLICLWNVNY